MPFDLGDNPAGLTTTGGPVAGDDRLQHVAPAMGAVDVARTQRSRSPNWLRGQRVIAGAGEEAVVGRASLAAVGQADRAIHIQDDSLERLASIDFADPRA